MNIRSANIVFMYIGSVCLLHYGCRTTNHGAPQHVILIDCSEYGVRTPDRYEYLMFAAKEWCDAARRNADISDRHVERMRANYEEWQRRKSKLYEVRELDAYFSPDEALRAVISQLYVRKNIWEDIARDYQQILKQCPEHPFHDDMLRAIEEMQQMIQEIGSAGEFIGPPIPRDYHPGGETNDVSSKEGSFGAEEYFW